MSEIFSKIKEIEKLLIDIRQEHWALELALEYVTEAKYDFDVN